MTSELSCQNCQSSNCPFSNLFQSDTHISELNLSQLAQGIHNLSADFIRNVQLYHAHIRRAEHGVFVGSHSEKDGVVPVLLAMDDDVERGWVGTIVEGEDGSS